ncbi:hypothetical protein ACQ86G_26420 [Roseateles chitinivorans]|uniref:hypothetical protein n=1 Tax=Roseateles chitinivorans TaxID=2917965 RepID=UPI003D665576
MIGKIQRFSMEVGPLDSRNRMMRVVNIFVGGKNVSECDNSVYVPQFIASLGRATEALKRKIDYTKYEPFFFKHSLEEAYAHLAGDDDGDLFGACRVLDFGPTTDSSLSFLIPHHGRLYLASRVHHDGDDEAPPVIVEMTAYEMIRVMEMTEEVLRSAS